MPPALKVDFVTEQ